MPPIPVWAVHLKLQYQYQLQCIILLIWTNTEHTIHYLELNFFKLTDKGNNTWQILLKISKKYLLPVLLQYYQYFLFGANFWV